MKYIMKSGNLFSLSKHRPIAQIKNVLWSQEKTILLMDQEEEYKTGIDSNAAPEKRGDVRLKQYTLKGADDKVILTGYPAYAAEDNPDVLGWPVCRLPKVDHMNLIRKDESYQLTMRNSQYYSMKDAQGYMMLEVLHRGIAGGWEINADDHFTPEVICAVFLFCRYLEQENEFTIV